MQNWNLICFEDRHQTISLGCSERVWSLFLFYTRLNKQVACRETTGSTIVPGASFPSCIHSALETKAETSWGVSPGCPSFSNQTVQLIWIPCEFGIWPICIFHTKAVQKTFHLHQQVSPSGISGPLESAVISQVPQSTLPLPQLLRYFPLNSLPAVQKCQEQQFQGNARRIKFSTCLNILLDGSQSVPCFIKWNLQDIKLWCKK